MLDQIIHSVVTFFVILDPLGVAVIYAGLTHGATDDFRHRTALQATLIAGLLLLLFGAVGDQVLAALDVSMPAFRIAGGLLLFLLATEMVFARQSGIRMPTAPEEQEARRQRDLSVFPLAFPLLAGPGALTSIVLSVGGAQGFVETAAVFASMLAVLLLSFLALLAAGYIMRLLGVTGANVIGRVLGVVLAALAAQYVVDGVIEVVRQTK